MSKWIKKLTEAYSEVTVNESKFLIPEEIPTAERNAYMGAAAAAHKAGKSHFDFAGKKHPVTMKKDTATAIADQKENMGEEEVVVMNPKKDKKEKKDANAEAEMAAEETVNELDKKTLGSYIKKAGVDGEVQKAKAARHADAGDMADKDKDMYKHYAKSQRATDKSNNRVKGINKAVDKLTAESKQASLAKKLAKASASSEKGKAAVTLPKAPFEIPKKESVELTREEKAPVYSKILENRAAHYKKAAKAQEWDDAEKSNKGAQDMRSDHAVDDTDKVSNYDKLGHDDASKANKAGPNTKPRSNDNKAGDKKIMNPVAGAVTKE